MKRWARFFRGKLLRSYVGAGSASLSGRVAATIGGILFIWLLTRILEKAEFGLFMIAFTVISVCGSLVASGFERIVLYRVPEDAEGEFARKISEHMLFWTLTLGVVVSGLIALTAVPVASLLRQPELEWWLLGLSGLVVLEALRFVAVAWCRACERIGVAIVYQDLLHQVSRVLLLGLVWLLAAPKEFVILGLYAASATPLLVFLPRERLFPKNHYGVLTRADLWYGAQMFGTQAVNQPTRRIDTIILGGLAPAAAVAEYALASKMSTLLLIGKQTVLPLLAPRLRISIADRDMDQAGREYAATRIFSAAAALGGGLLLLVFGRDLLLLFGEYGDAIGPLLVLAAAVVVRTGTGACGEYVAMAGHGRTVLTSSVLGLIVTVGLAFLLAPEYAALGMAGAVFCGTVVNNLVLIAAVVMIERVWLLDWMELLMLSLFAGAMIATAVLILQPAHAVMVMVAAMIIYLLLGGRTALNLSKLFYAQDLDRGRGSI